MHRLIFVFFFFSGFTSLVFEVVWERALAKVFGTSSLALSTLLTAFMAGLALGSWLGGRYAERIKHPLRTYGMLEGLIGLYAMCVPAILALMPSVYQALFDAYIQDLLVFSLLRFAVVFLVLLVPTTMMGATLPIVSQWIAQREQRFQGSIGILYGLNTLGACTGALLAGFGALPNMGLAQTNLVFAISNWCLCAVVIAFDRFADVDIKTDALSEEFEVIHQNVETHSLTNIDRRVIMFAFGAGGLVSMCYQVLWTRAYVIVLGSSTYSFTIILTAFLAALALGSAVFSSFVHRISKPVWWLGLTQSGFALGATLTFFLLDDLPEWLFHRLREDIGNPSEIYLYQFGLVGVCVFLPVFLQGAAFPLVMRALVDTPEEAGPDVGRAYAFNTGGAIFGSFMAGFALLPAFGLRESLTITICINLLLAAAYIGLLIPRGLKVAVAPAAVCAVAALTLALSPTIDQVRLTRGMFRTYWARELFDPDKLAKDNPELLFYEDGVTATISVEGRGRLVTLKANGKPEASDGADMATQILVALAPFLVRSLKHDVGGEEVAMVGFGSGVTAGAALQWPLKRLDVVEIEPEMIGASKFFEHVNHKPLEDDRCVLYESDGRNFLEYTNNRYDIIVSEPSNPWIAGVASLFTVEHFERVKRKLKPDGVFAQWVQLYEIRPENVRRIMATFRTSFPHAVAFSSMPKGTDLILVGSQEPLDLPPEGFQTAMQNETVAAELKRAGIHSPTQFYGLMFMNAKELAAFAEGADLNTDDNGLLEFEAPKDLIRYDVGDKYFQERYFGTSDYGDPRPHLASFEQWKRDDVGAIAKSAWLSGKDKLADDLLQSHNITAFDPSFSGDLRDMMFVRHAQGLDLDEAVQAIWPNSKSEMHALAVDAARGEKHLQAMIYLESDGVPKIGGFEGERGLAYAYILARRRYYKHALKQIKVLEKKDDPMIHTPLFGLVKGFITWKRRRYNASFNAYLTAAKALSDDGAKEDQEEPEPQQ